MVRTMTLDADRMPVIVVGAGGHGAVVCEVLRAAGASVIGFADEAAERIGPSVLDVPVFGMDSLPAPSEAAVIVGIGSNAARRDVFDTLTARGYVMRTAVHPSAIISPSARVAHGVAIMAGVIVNARTVVEAGAVLNTGCRVDHDCVIGAHAHVAPGSTLTGAVRVGTEALIGAGAVVLPGRTVGARAVVGAGAAVAADVEAETVVAGVPARAVRR